MLGKRSLKRKRLKINKEGRKQTKKKHSSRAAETEVEVQEEKV